MGRGPSTRTSASWALASHLDPGRESHLDPGRESHRDVHLDPRGDPRCDGHRESHSDVHAAPPLETHRDQHRDQHRDRHRDRHRDQHRDTGAHRRSERGSVTPLIVGFAVVLALGIALVTDATAAYLQRSGLSTLADGAALAGADAGASGRSTYTEGVPTDELPVDVAAARAGVAAYLRQVRALEEYPGLRWSVRVDGATSSVFVRLTAPLDLPLALLTGAPEETLVSAEGEGSTSVED